MTTTAQDYYVDVCKNCGEAECWYGTFYCYEYLTADIKRVKASTLNNPPSVERVLEVCGSINYVREGLAREVKK